MEKMDSCSYTPSKNKTNCDNRMMLSPITRTPIRQNNLLLKTNFPNHARNLSLLPNHITPPSGLAKFMARNPFEAELTSKLHISVMSPTVFSKTTDSPKDSPGFTWSIDELALIQPAKIDEFPLQQMHCSDPDIERTAQEAISKFFSENQIIPSPYEVKSSEFKVTVDLQTPIKSQEEINVSREFLKNKKEKKDSWTQTVLTLPPNLPKYVEEILKPYYNFTQDQIQNFDNEEANSSNSSLRRKLLFHDDEIQDESVSLGSPPSRPESSLIHSLSPPQSGMFFHGTPLKSATSIVQRTYGTPLACRQSSSPCDVSPISNPTSPKWSNMSYQSIKSRNKSVARLNFTNDMSIECQDENEVENNENKNMCKTLFSNQVKKYETTSCNTDDESFGDITQISVTCENSTRYKYEDKENVAPNMINLTSTSKCSKVGKTLLNENYALQQSKMLSGNRVQQITFSSTQDTGYQTYSSSSNVTNNVTNMDSYNNLTKQKFRWDEQTTHEEVQLTDWENTKNMISSTPSKFNRGISNF